MLEIIRYVGEDWRRYTALHKKMNLLLFLAVFFHNPGMFFSVLYRFERYALLHPFILIKLLGVVFYPIYFIITYYILSIDISPRVKIGKGLYVHNRGIIFTDQVTVGDNLTLIGPLTFGTKGFILSDDPKGPTVGSNVTVYAGARVVGPIKIGDHVFVGANAVVATDIESYSVVGGIPAKILRKISR